MKAEDIRSLNERCQKFAGESTISREQQDVGLKSIEVSMLTEIAAQLAEANESLKYIAHPLMEVQSAEQAAGEKTLRDEFAMAALQGLMMANYQDCPFPGGYAEEAYKVADSMLEARKK